MSSNAAEQKWLAPCGCGSTIIHRSSCRLVHGDAATMESVEQIRCDTEDGCVWLHVGNTVAPMAPRRARQLAGDLVACAQEVEKPR